MGEYELGVFKNIIEEVLDDFTNDDLKALVARNPTYEQVYWILEYFQKTKDPRGKVFEAAWVKLPDSQKVRKTSSTRTCKSGHTRRGAEPCRTVTEPERRKLAHLDEYQHSNPVTLALFLMIFFIVGVVWLRFTRSVAEPKKRCRKAAASDAKPRNSP